MSLQIFYVAEEVAQAFQSEDISSQVVCNTGETLQVHYQRPRTEEAFHCIYDDAQQYVIVSIQAPYLSPEKSPRPPG